MEDMSGYTNLAFTNHSRYRNTFIEQVLAIYSKRNTIVHVLVSNKQVYDHILTCLDPHYNDIQFSDALIYKNNTREFLIDNGDTKQTVTRGRLINTDSKQAIICVWCGKYETWNVKHIADTHQPLDKKALLFIDQQVMAYQFKNQDITLTYLLHGVPAGLDSFFIDEYKDFATPVIALAYCRHVFFGFYGDNEHMEQVLYNWLANCAEKHQLLDIIKTQHKYIVKSNQKYYIGILSQEEKRSFAITIFCTNKNLHAWKKFAANGNVVCKMIQ
jgi:hypothetical protein